MQKSIEVSEQRATLMRGAMIAAPVTIGVWFAITRLAPPFGAGMDLDGRLVFALKCVCVAVLFCFVTGVEAISHERLFSPAIDPLAGQESLRMRVNVRYLQHTLEQLVLFVPGLFALATYGDSAGSLREVIAATVIWMAGRLMFWIGYQRSPRYRGAGLVGMAQSLLILLYVTARFGSELCGALGAVVPVVAFLAIEAYLVWLSVWRRPKPY